MSSTMQRLAWTEEEDEYLIAAVQKYGVKRWAQIAQGLPGRTSKACSHRWRTYLQPGVKHTSTDPFSEWEIAVVQEAHKAVGNNWSAIAKMLPGRTNAAVKNFWYAHRRRELRAMEKQRPAEDDAGAATSGLVNTESRGTQNASPSMVDPNRRPGDDALLGALAPSPGHSPNTGARVGSSSDASNSPSLGPSTSPPNCLKSPNYTSSSNHSWASGLTAMAAPACCSAAQAQGLPCTMHGTQLLGGVVHGEGRPMLSSLASDGAVLTEVVHSQYTSHLSVSQSSAPGVGEMTVVADWASKDALHQLYGQIAQEGDAEALDPLGTSAHHSVTSFGNATDALVTSKLQGLRQHLLHRQQHMQQHHQQHHQQHMQQHHHMASMVHQQAMPAHGLHLHPSHPQHLQQPQAQPPGHPQPQAQALAHQQHPQQPHAHTHANHHAQPHPHPHANHPHHLAQHQLDSHCQVSLARVGSMPCQEEQLLLHGEDGLLADAFVVSASYHAFHGHPSTTADPGMYRPASTPLPMQPSVASASGTVAASTGGVSLEAQQLHFSLHPELDADLLL